MEGIAISFEKSLTLTQLERKLAHQEMAIGKLTSLGRTGEVTVGVYEDTDPPAAFLKLATVAETAVVPPGATKLCEGRVWITGQPQKVVAYRPA